MTSDEKLCPYCGETIKSIAIKCRHCKSDLKQEIATNPVAMKNCTFCGESIEIDATDCHHCKSTLLISKGENDTYSQNHISAPYDDTIKFERNALIYTGYASAVFNAIYYLLIDKYFSQNLYTLALVFNISVSIFCAVMYVKDRKQLTRDERDDIPWYSNLFFILFFAVVAIPLYLAWIAKRTNIKSDAIKAFIGYAIAISIGIFVSISVTNKMMEQFGLGTLSSPETINENNLSLNNPSNWEKIGDTDIASVYIDVNNIERVGRNYRVVSLYDFKISQSDGYNKYLSYSSYSEYDCTNKLSLDLKSTTYSGKMGKGSEKITTLNDSWSSYIPNTPAYVIVNIVCKN